MKERKSYSKGDVEAKRLYHREYNRTYMKEWAKKHPDKVKATYIKGRTENRLGKLLTSTRRTAKLKGLEHTITKEDLVKVDKCPLTGISIDWSVSGRHLANPSIDRTNPSKGYIPGNVEIMSCLGNTMKNCASKEQLVFFAKEILRRYGSDV